MPDRESSATIPPNLVLQPDGGYGDDMLYGVSEIAEFIAETVRRTEDLLTKRRLPAFKDGGRLWRMRKSTYREFQRQREAIAFARALENVTAAPCCAVRR